MYYHSQNLTEDWPGKKGVALPIIWRGRSWLRRSIDGRRGRELHWEWGLGKFARDFSLTLNFGYGDGDDGILFHICIPWLFFLFIGLNGIYRCKECNTGIKIHDNAIWISPLSYSHEWCRKFPWWRKDIVWNFPWSYDWYKTEILDHDVKTVVWSEDINIRDPFLISWNNRKEKEKAVSKEYPFSYTLKNGTIQNRIATVHVYRQTHKMKWYPLFWGQKIRTSIDFTFNDEVGEGSGSYKGGVISSGYELLTGETPEQCLRRMEKERKF